MSGKLKKLFTEFTIGKAADAKGGDTIIEGWANKAVVDDVGDLMKFDSVDLGRYKKNPILLYNHDRNIPIGRVLEIKVSEAGLWVKAVISNSSDTIVSYVRDLVKEGILKTFSIGFEPKEENYNRAEGYNEIRKWRLNEISIVTLPANIDAEFSLAKSLGEAKDYAEARALVLKALEDQKPGEPKVTDTTTEKAPCPDCGKDPCECKKPAEGEGEKPEGESSPEDEEAKKKAAFQDCVQAKIPKLIEEGKPEEQAVAIAMSMCREEGKCDISIMSSEMFALAMETAKGCKKPKDGEKEGETPSEPPADGEKSLNKEVPPPAAPINTGDTPTDYGNPHIEMLKAQLAMMGKISTQLETIAKLLEKEDDMGENDNGSNPSLPPENGEASAKGLAKLAEIHGRIKAMAQDIGV